MRNAYLSALYDLAKANQRIIALVADNGAIVYDKFREDFPERFFNFGIAEANMLSVAAGLSSCGFIPFAYTIANFLTMRAFEQVRNDLCLQRMNVKLVGIGAGFVYSNLGPTHHATEDIAIMRSLPGMTIFSCADALEARKATICAGQINGPVYIRLATAASPAVYKADYDFTAGKAVTLRKGTDITIIATGGIVAEAVKAAEELEKEGISVNLINVHTIKPFDKEAIFSAAKKTKAVLTIEEHTILGGLGSAVAEALLEEGIGRIKFKRLGLMGVFPEGYGSYEEMKEMNHLSKSRIKREARGLL